MKDTIFGICAIIGVYLAAAAIPATLYAIGAALVHRRPKKKRRKEEMSRELLRSKRNAPDCSGGHREER